MEIPTALQPVLRLLTPIAEDFTAAGHRLYLVGGVVRDIAFGVSRDLSDLDLTTDARPDFISSVLEPHASVLWTQGERFGTIGAQIEGKAVEITTHRTEIYASDTRKPEVNFGDSLDVDLSRRDFTINAMAISIPDGEFFDPHGGLSHVDQKLLVTPIDPVVSFSDDPLRMLRAARFLPRFGLAPDPKLQDAAAGLKDRLDVVSRERISAELDRLFEVSAPRLGFDFLLEVGLLPWAVPALRGCSEEDLVVSAALASSPGNPDVRRAGLLYMLSQTDRFESVQQALAQLRYSVEVQNRSARLLQELEAVLIVDASIQDVRRLVSSLGISITQNEPNQLVSDLRQLASNVSAVVPGVSFDGSFFDVLYEAVAVVGTLHYKSALSGHEVMELLDAPAGPAIGQAKMMLRDHWVQTGASSAESARECLLSWSRDL